MLRSIHLHVNKILNEELNKTRFVNHFVLRELISGFQCSGYLMCVFVLIRIIIIFIADIFELPC